MCAQVLTSPCGFDSRWTEEGSSLSQTSWRGEAEVAELSCPCNEFGIRGHQGHHTHELWRSFAQLFWSHAALFAYFVTSWEARDHQWATTGRPPHQQITVNSGGFSVFLPCPLRLSRLQYPLGMSCSPIYGPICNPFHHTGTPTVMYRRRSAVPAGQSWLLMEQLRRACKPRSRHFVWDVGVDGRMPVGHERARPPCTSHSIIFGALRHVFYFPSMPPEPFPGFQGPSSSC